MKSKKSKAFDRKKENEAAKKVESPTTIPIHNYWLFSILAMITTSMFRKKAGLEIILQGTTYQVNFFTISIIAILLCALFAAIYYKYRNHSLNGRFTNLHTMLTLGVIGTVFLTAFKEQIWDVDEILITGIGVFIVAQAILIGNIMQSKRLASNV